MATLYELSSDLLELLEMAEDPDVDREVLVDTMEAVEGSYEQKMEGYAVVIKEIEADIEKYKKEALRLMQMADTGRNAINTMKKTMLYSMEMLDKPKVQTEHFKLSRVKNGGVQPMWVTPELVDIPEEYLIRKPVPDTEKIREALKNGEEFSFARLEERGVHLSIR